MRSVASNGEGACLCTTATGLAAAAIATPTSNTVHRTSMCVAASTLRLAMGRRTSITAMRRVASNGVCTCLCTTTTGPAAATIVAPSTDAVHRTRVCVAAA
eukprot:TRINITY_DN6631_c0_g2_i3.p4 TRINITY_DN6631_c0_g2~~TRINITY_DN6631_c0_g2_i3.p4  ORF type:complete len:101 (-),score=2.93 TRINITY_DN6631_c0_g2_i3:468-770(-)